MNDPRFEVFPEVDSDPGMNVPGAERTSFYWRFRAANGQITAVGGEGFTRREDARRAVGDLIRDIGMTLHTDPAHVIDVDE